MSRQGRGSCGGGVGGTMALLLLRIALAVTFIWAGLGKVLGTFEVQGESAAVLARMGVIAAPTVTAPPPNAETPATGGTTTEESTTATGAAAIDESRFNAANFAKPIEVERVYGLALLIHRVGNPVPPADATAAAPMALWPKMLSEGGWPVRQAWAVAVTELLGGFALLVGLGTRLWGLALAGVMLGAIWLTEVGKAIAAGNTVLGFIPAYEFDNPDLWKSLLWQVLLLSTCLALVLAGAGRASLDAALFGVGGEDDGDDL